MKSSQVRQSHQVLPPDATRLNPERCSVFLSKNPDLEKENSTKKE